MTLQLLAVAGLGLLALIGRRVAGTWAHPSPVTAAAWTAFLAIPTAIGLNAGALGILVSLGVVLAALIAAPISVRPDEAECAEVECTSLLWRFVLIGALAGGGAGLLVLSANGISPTSLGDLAAINLAAREATVLRYGAGLAVPLLAILLLGLTYGASLAAPFAAAGTKGVRGLVLLVAPTAGGALYAVATTARAGFLISAALTAAAWLVVQGLRHSGRPTFRFRSLAGAAAANSALVFMFLYAATTRLGGWSSSHVTVLLEKVAIYAGGAIPAFHLWASEAETFHFGFGTQTFAGAAQFLPGFGGIGDAYDDRVQVAPGLSTNVYTMLRPLTEDFTVPGAIIAFLVGSIAAAVLYRRAVVTRSVASAVACSVWMAVVLFSSTTSILTFANVTFGVLIAAWLIVRTCSVAAVDVPVPGPKIPPGRLCQPQPSTSIPMVPSQ